MHTINLNNIKKLLIVRFSSLGDVLLTTPLIRSIKNNYPNIEIDYVVREEYADVLKYNPNINTLYRIVKDKENELGKRLCDAGYDLVIDLQNNIRSRRLTKKLNGLITRFPKPSAKKFLLVNFKINLLKDIKPIPVRYAETINGFQLDDAGLDLYLPPEEKQNENRNGKLIALCPGSRHFTKQWPKENFVEFGNLLKGVGFDVALLGGRDDIGICEEICEQIPGSVNYCNDNNLFKTAAAMNRCALVVCNDSGLMHTATALRVPVMAIFGSTVKEFGFAPYKSQNLILENNLLSCRPCSHIGRSKCPKKHFKCMKELTAENLFQQFKKYYSTL